MLYIIRTDGLFLKNSGPILSKIKDVLANKAKFDSLFISGAKQSMIKTYIKESAAFKALELLTRAEDICEEKHGLFLIKGDILNNHVYGNIYVLYTINEHLVEDLSIFFKGIFSFEQGKQKQSIGMLLELLVDKTIHGNSRIIIDEKVLNFYQNMGGMATPIMDDTVFLC